MMLTCESVFSVPSPWVKLDDGEVISGRYDESDVRSSSWFSVVAFMEAELEGPTLTTASGSTLSSMEDESDSGAASVNIAVFRFVQGQRSDLS